MLYLQFVSQDRLTACKCTGFFIAIHTHSHNVSVIHTLKHWALQGNSAHASDDWDRSLNVCIGEMQLFLKLSPSPFYGIWLKSLLVPCVCCNAFLCSAGGDAEPLSLWWLCALYTPVLPYSLDQWKRLMELWALLLQVPGPGHQH